MKIETITSSRKVYSEKCKRCKKKIKAFSESNFEYNMRLHKEKCEKSHKDKKE